MNKPKTLDEAVDGLIANMSQEDKDMFAKEPEDCPGARFHFSTGMAMRNDWGLWHKDSELSNWFRFYGIWHGDDKSACIFKALWCKLNDKPFDIKKEAEYYKEFWRKTAGIGFDGEKLPGIDSKAIGTTTFEFINGRIRSVVKLFKHD